MIEYLHTMIRVGDLDATTRFFCDGLGLKELRRTDNEAGRFTLVFLASALDQERFMATGGDAHGGLPAGLPMIELTYNWDENSYQGGRNFGHLAYRVDDIYAACERLQSIGVEINRPPRDGRMAFVRSPDGISVELLQKGTPKEAVEPWASMPNVGSW
jgi:lactoylglutathione lyase